MNRRSFISLAGLVGLNGLTAVGLASRLISITPPIILPSKSVIDTSVLVPSNYSVIEAHEMELTKFYLDGLRKVWRSGLDEAMNAHGDEKMHGVYFKLYLDSLNHARDKIAGKAGDDELVFKGIAEEYTAALKKYDLQKAVDFTGELVDESYRRWAEHNSEFYGELLSQEDFGDFGKLLRGAYPKKEGFEKLLMRQDDRIDLIYDAFSKSVIGNVGIKLAAKVPLGMARKHAKAFYRSARMKDYAE